MPVRFWLWAIILLFCISASHILFSSCLHQCAIVGPGGSLRHRGWRPGGDSAEVFRNGAHGLLNHEIEEREKASAMMLRTGIRAVAAKVSAVLLNRGEARNCRRRPRPMLDSCWPGKGSVDLLACLLAYSIIMFELLTSR